VRSTPVSLDTSTFATVAIYVVDAASKRPLPDVHVDFGLPAGLQREAVTDTSGIAHFHVPAGTHSFRARRIWFKTYTTKVDVRRGAADTLSVGLGRDHICLF
jgi:hypothetical protein